MALKFTQVKNPNLCRACGKPYKRYKSTYVFCNKCFLKEAIIDKDHGDMFWVKDIPGGITEYDWKFL